MNRVLQSLGFGLFVGVMLLAAVARVRGEKPESRPASGPHGKEHVAGEHVVFSPSALQWRDGPPSLPAGIKMAVLAGDPEKPGPFTMRFHIPAGCRAMPHWHPADENVTVISGTVFMGLGEKFDTTQGMRLETGAFATMPAKKPHFAWANDEAIVQIHGVGPWGITYVNPADDPRGKRTE